VAVSANDLAFLYLREHQVPPSVVNPVSNIEFLVSEVIELQHYGVSFAAIRTGVRSKEIHKEIHSLPEDRLVAG
jgi:hypothetical protein